MEKKKTDLKEILSFLLILAGSAILAINMNTFVEQGGLVPGGFCWGLLWEQALPSSLSPVVNGVIRQ